MAEQRSLIKTYLKTCSLERSSGVPNASDNSNAVRSLNLVKEVIELPDNRYEVTLTFTLTALKEEKVVYLVEVSYSGLFLLVDLTPEDLKEFLEKTAPYILEPYMKAELNELLLKAELPLLPLNSLNW